MLKFNRVYFISDDGLEAGFTRNQAHSFLYAFLKSGY